MKERIKRILRRLERERSIAFFGVLALATVGLIAATSGATSIHVPAGGHGTPIAVASLNGIKLAGTLSQSKFVQGQPSEAYLTLSVVTPDMPSDAARQAADTIVILDHSGSMSADNRLPYAKRAAHDLIDRLTPNDRLGFVVFDSSAQILAPLQYVTAEAKSALHATVEAIHSGSGTNMSAGITLAKSLMRGRHGERGQKIILLSDGEANEGVTDSRALGEMVSAINKESASVSTVGMGLGFNEQLMASLADWGGGSFSYLEHLDKLGEILNRNIDDARRLFAATSTLELKLHDSVSLRDSAGYPVETSGSVAKIPLGQLLSGSDKRVTLTFDVPTTATREFELGAVSLRVTTSSGEETVQLPAGGMQVAVVEPARRAEAFASVKQDEYRAGWIANNFGAMQRKMQSALKDGNVPGARRDLAEYKAKLAAAESMAAAPLQSDSQLTAKMENLERELDDAGSGSSDEVAQKSNRLGKKYLAEGMGSQRR